MKREYPNLKDRPWVRNRHVKKLFALFREAGFEARIVGGAVRNALLSRPVHEIDMAVNMPPEDVLSLGKSAGFNVVPTGLDHGTVTFIMGEAPSRSVEVTSLRTDVDTDGRHADIAFTNSWESDARRRDFTMNALYCNEEGEIYDPLGGIDDIISGKIIFIGDAQERVKEDYLRILRFFRFSAEFGQGTLDKIGLRACTKLQSGLEQLSVERIGQEFLKLLIASHAVPILQQLSNTGIYQRLMPGVCDVSILKDVIHFEAHFSLAPNPLRRLAAFLLPAYKKGALSAEVVQEKLSLSSRQCRVLNRIWDFALQGPATLSSDDFGKYIYFWGEDVSLDVMALLYGLGREKDLSLWNDFFQFNLHFKMPVFPVSGDDLIHIGYAPGPKLGAELKRLEMSWVDSNFTLPPEELLKMST